VHIVKGQGEKAKTIFAVVVVRVITEIRRVGNYSAYSLTNICRNGQQTTWQLAVEENEKLLLLLNNLTVLCCACAILRLAIISACLVCPFHRVASTFVVNKRSLLYLFIYL